MDTLFLQDLTAAEMIEGWVARAPVGLAFLDAECRYVRVNDALAVLHGLAPEDHVGRHVDEVGDGFGTDQIGARAGPEPG